MAIIHTKQRSNFISFGKYLLLGLVVAVITRLLLSVSPLITIAGLIICFYLVYRGSSFLVGAVGEWLVKQTIKNNLNHRYHLFNDINIPNNQIDHLLIGPKGIITIETKHYFRTVYSSSNKTKWKYYVNRKPYYINSPLTQSQGHSICLEKEFNKTGVSTNRIKAIVVMTGLGKIKVGWQNKYVFRRREFLEYINNQKDILSDEQIKFYVEKIKLFK